MVLSLRREREDQKHRQQINKEDARDAVDKAGRVAQESSVATALESNASGSQSSSIAQSSTEG